MCNTPIIISWKIQKKLISDSKSCLNGLNWPRSEKTLTFWHFFGCGGDIRYWLEMTSFWFVMVLLVTSNIGR